MYDFIISHKYANARCPNLGEHLNNALGGRKKTKQRKNRDAVNLI